MNYRNIYIQIIAKAKREMQQGLRPKNYNQKKNFPNQYFEAHHILPKSLFPLWKKRKTNLAMLTPREHYFCHELLTKIFPGRSMNYALVKLTYSKFHHPSARQYEKAKLLNYQNSLGESNPNYGHKWSEAQKRAASERAKLQNKLYGNGNKGNFWNKSQKESQSEKSKGRRYFTNGLTTIKVVPGEEPEGFYPGHSSSFLPKTEEGKKSKSDHAKNMRHDFNTGKAWYHSPEGKNILAFECPEGFTKGKYISEEKLKEMKRKNSEAHKGKQSGNKGKHYSLPKRPGQHWYTNGKVNTRATACPDGFWLGRI